MAITLNYTFFCFVYCSILIYIMHYVIKCLFYNLNKKIWISKWLTEDLKNWFILEFFLNELFFHLYLWNYSIGCSYNYGFLIGKHFYCSHLAEYLNLKPWHIRHGVVQYVNKLFFSTINHHFVINHVLKTYHAICMRIIDFSLLKDFSVCFYNFVHIWTRSCKFQCEKVHKKYILNKITHLNLS